MRVNEEVSQNPDAGLIRGAGPELIPPFAEFALQGGADAAESIYRGQLIEM